MMSKISRFLLIIMLLALSIALGGCRGDKTSENSSLITIGIPQDIEDSLDPHLSVAAGTKEVLFNIFEGLVKPDCNGNMVPALASSIEIQDGGGTYFFVLRDGVTFHDGSKVSVEDVKYSIDKCAGIIDGNEPLVEAFSEIKEVVIADDKSIKVVLDGVNMDFLPYMSVAIIPKSNDSPATNPIGTGPYRYVSRSPQENFILEAYDGYWGGEPNIKNVIFKIVSNVDTVVMELQGGGIDMYARLTPSAAKELSDDFLVLNGTMNLVQALYINNSDPILSDMRVRQALSYVINPEDIIDIVSDGGGVAIGSSMFPSYAKYYDESINDKYNLDLDKAKELLSEAGLSDGFDMNITVPSNYQQHVDTAIVIADQLKKVGINASIELVEWDSWINDVYIGRRFQTTVIGVDAPYLSARALLERFRSDSDSNFINYSSKTYDEAYDKALGALDDTDRTQYYMECLNILSDEAANVYIQDLPEYVALRKGYGGYQFYPVYVQDISKLYIEDSE